MMQRALNCVDSRLVDHGLRVATILDAMLAVKGTYDETQRRAAYFVALLHDIGAYRTEEIDRMVAFETEGVWEHSFYGFLFFRELSPLVDYAEVVLFHHMDYDRFTGQSPQVKFLATALHVADRVDVLLLEHPQADAADVMRLMDAVRPGTFAPEALELFAEAERRYGVLAYLRGGVEEPNPSRIVADPTGTGTATSYLDMLVHIIDFRSRHTVTHTVTTAWVAYELALRLLGDKGAAAHVYASALVHDVGKIGIPLSILENRGASMSTRWRSCARTWR
ncbi:HD domain-containing protein [Eggerthella sinensis]|uniref:HD domain-containing protein n=1 Tax=Eggerthella sinensis TaxID=242230 RepID=UPI0022E0687A|nr:HD domain-containing protein [Eggerthella sinensis]